MKENKLVDLSKQFAVDIVKTKGDVHFLSIFC